MYSNKVKGFFYPGNAVSRIMRLSRIIAAIAFAICFTAVANDVLANTSVQEKVTDAKNGIASINCQGDALPDEVVVRLLKFENGVYNFVATDTTENRQL